MTSMLSRAVAAVRVWLGFDDPSGNHPQLAHAWLLPPVALAKARPSARAATASPMGTFRLGQKK